MANEMIRGMIMDSLNGDELYHHGILNMSWGVRNGPPYPLRGAGKKISAKLRSEKQKLVRRLKAKKTLKEQKEAEDIYKRKATILASGNLNKIYKNRDLFTAEELEAALLKKRMEDETKLEAKRTHLKDPHRYDSALETTAAIGKAAANLVPVAELGMKLAGLSEKSRDIKAKDAERGAKEFDRRIGLMKEFNEDEALKLFNDTYKTKITKKKSGAKFDKGVFDALTAIDPSAAAKYMSDLLGGADVNSTGTNKFNKQVFDALAAIDPSAAAKYMGTMVSGVEVKYDDDALSKYMAAIGKSKPSGGGEKTT